MIILEKYHLYEGLIFRKKAEVFFRLIQLRIYKIKQQMPQLIPIIVLYLFENS